VWFEGKVSPLILEAIDQETEPSTLTFVSGVTIDFSTSSFSSDDVSGPVSALSSSTNQLGMSFNPRFSKFFGSSF
jgi:hypothetical protein